MAPSFVRYARRPSRPSRPHRPPPPLVVTPTCPPSALLLWVPPPTTARPPVPHADVRRWKRFFFAWQCVQVAAVAYVGGTYAHDLQVTVYATTIDVGPYVGTHVPFPSTLTRVGDVSLFWLYVQVPAWTALHYLVTLCDWSAFVRALDVDHAYAVRWWEYGISASLMTVTLAALCGVTTVAALVNVGVATAAVQACGAVAERRYAAGRSPWPAFTVGAVVFTASYGSTVVASFARHRDDAPSFVVAVVVVTTLLYLLFPLVHVLYCTGTWSFRDADRAYDVLSLVSKAALDWLIVGGLVGWNTR